MDLVFDESLVLSFKEVVEESVRQIFEGKGMSAFQQALRNGMNQICCAIQQRAIEFIDYQLRTNISLRLCQVKFAISDRDPIRLSCFMPG